MLFKTLIIACILHVVESGGWNVLGSPGTVHCVGAKGNAFKELVYTGTPGFMGAVKLIHEWGLVGCNTDISRLSYWGCKGETADLRMVITDSKNKMIYPAPRLVKLTSWKGYSLPVYSSMSNELVLSDIGNPLYLNTGDKLRIWYSEDLFDHYDYDNQGFTCMKVQVYIFGFTKT